MKNGRFALLISSLLVTTCVFSQDGATWKVTLNKKTVINTGVEDTIANRIQVKKSDLSNNGIFKIEYIEPKDNPNKSWVRTMAVLDTAAGTVFQLDSAKVMQVLNKNMLKVLWTRKKINAYTWAAPSDPGMAAAIRIRRLHLCTIELID